MKSYFPHDITNVDLKKTYLTRAFCIYISDYDVFNQLDSYEVSNIFFAMDLYDQNYLHDLEKVLARFNCQKTGKLYSMLILSLFSAKKISQNFSTFEDIALFSSFYHGTNPQIQLPDRDLKSISNRIKYWKQKLKKSRINLSERVLELVHVDEEKTYNPGEQNSQLINKCDEVGTETKSYQFLTSIKEKEKLNKLFTKMEKIRKIKAEKKKAQHQETQEIEATANTSPIFDENFEHIGGPKSSDPTPFFR